jgi:OmpA-OmpF porin, OOP family
MNRKLFVVGLCVAVVLGTAGLAPQAGASGYSNGAFYLTPMAGGIFYFDNPDIYDGAIVGGRIGAFFSKSVSLELAFDYAFSNYKGPPPIGGTNAHHFYGLLNGLYHFEPVLSDKLHFFLLGGIGIGQLDSSVPLSADTGFAGNYGAGAQYVLSDMLALRGEVRHLLVTGIPESNLIVSLGLALNFGGEEAAPPPPPAAEPMDSDDDGVVDPQDACPGTPRGCIVDVQGCPLDGDLDGVCDGIDQCPDTPKGAKVDEKGCSFHGGVLEGINFAFDKAVILTSSWVVLDDAELFLKNNPKTVVEIGGHTDSVGKAAYNQKLSERRADAVRQYLISKGVPASQMTSRGYGASKPIADNATDAGRAKNRRIEFTILSE